MNPRADRGCLFNSRRLTANLDGVPNEGLTPVAPVFLICLEIWIFFEIRSMEYSDAFLDWLAERYRADPALRDNFRWKIPAPVKTDRQRAITAARPRRRRRLHCRSAPCVAESRSG